MSVLIKDVFERSTPRRSNKASRYLKGVPTVLALFFGSGVALAQQVGVENAEKRCTASMTSLEPGEPASLLVACGTQVFPLGQAESFRMVDLPDLNSVIVITKADRHPRVWMLIQQHDGSYTREDISGLIARNAGRGASRDLRGIDLEIDEQPAVSRGGATIRPAQNRGLGVLANVDLAAVATRSRATTQEHVAEENGGSGAAQ